MTAPEPVRAVRHAGALQCALSAAARACASYRIGATRIGDDALLSASEMVTVAFAGGTPEAMALSVVLDAVESIGDAAEFERIVVGLTGGAR
ncbi:MAG: hypothetical protein ABSF03_10415 [Streptosporangiaceae bacterium]|jgi:hypothetical protein